MIAPTKIRAIDGNWISFDEYYDTQMEVARDPCGAHMAIQNQAARIAELEAERDAALVVIRLAYDEGYRAGVEDAANRITASIQMLRNLGMTEGAEVLLAAAEDISTLLNNNTE
jgi:hypothetical protein